MGLSTALLLYHAWEHGPLYKSIAESVHYLDGSESLCLSVGVQSSSACKAVNAFLSVLPEIREKGTMLSRGELPGDWLGKPLGVKAEGTLQGSCLQTMVETLAQACTTLQQSKGHFT
jgi:hypothetical protein